MPPQLTGRPTSPFLADEAPDVDIGQSLCKQSWPEKVSIYSSCLMRALILRDHHLIVVQDEGRVDAGELRDGGHGTSECEAGVVLVAG